ncbi:hypothetical protein ES705_22176 [subsurface metagenome]
MYNFCTLFDSLYLSRALVMYDSLKKHLDDFHLYIFAFDDLCFDILNNLKLSNTTIISLKEFENEELLKVKNDRTKAEYCWTCTPSVIDYVLKNYKVPNCTYLDADLYFYDSPVPLLREMNKNTSVLITEHRFSRLARLYEQNRAGRFCVQFITFTNRQHGNKILEKWKGQCIDWCYARYENGKFGDQKYLEDWPEKHHNVHILQHQGGGVAPWNVQQYKFRKDGSTLIGINLKNKLQFEVVFYHFQYVKQIAQGVYDVGWYLLPSDVKKLFYSPYLKRIAQIENMLQEFNYDYRTAYTKFKADSFKNFLKIGFKKATKYNIMKIN